MARSLSLTIAFFLTFWLSVLACPAAEAIGTSHPVQRGEAISRIVESFELSSKEANFVEKCLAHPDECFFVFSAMSRFNDIQFQPLQLYPDVAIGYRHADAIHLATMLGLVHGCIEERNSPFYPRAAMRRIDALKVILGASGLLEWRERFELVDMEQKTPYDDVGIFQPGQWWYPRYVNAAYRAGILPQGKVLRPEDAITETELEDFIQKALAASQA